MKIGTQVFRLRTKYEHKIKGGITVPQTVTGKKFDCLDLGGIFDNEKISDQIAMRFNAPKNCLILGHPGKNSIVVTKTAREINQPSGNIFFRWVKKCGKGLLKVSSVGLVQIDYSHWWFWTAEIEVQYYKVGDNKLFTPSLIDQKELEAILKNIVASDKDIPAYESYQEWIPEPCTIIWFDPFRMIGSIASPDPLESVYFHWKHFGKNKPNIGLLKPGVKVAYQADSAQNSRFALEATSIRLI